MCAAVASTACTGPVEIHTVHVPNAANGWVKVRTLQAIRAGLAAAPPAPRLLCGDLNIPRRELPDGEVISFARDSRGRLRPDRGRRVGRGRARRGSRSTRSRLPRRLPRSEWLRPARAELDLAGHRRSRRRMASGPPVRIKGASSKLGELSPRMARRGPQRPLGPGSRLTGSRSLVRTPRPRLPRGRSSARGAGAAGRPRRRCSRGSAGRC